MFTKIRQLLTQQPTNQPKKSQFHHPNISQSDISQCPFMNKNKNNTASTHNPHNQPNRMKQPKNTNNSDSDSQPQQKPKGGCPFMNTSQSKKNPSLGINHKGYDQPYISKYKYYLSTSKINFDAIKLGHKPTPIVRKVFDQYPIYLQHTLFYNSPDYKKVRTLQYLSRFLAYEQLREKGNKRYHKGKYLKALDYYERAMSLFRWLQYKQEKSVRSSHTNLDDISSQSQLSQDETASKIPLKLQEQTNSYKVDNSDFDQFRSNYKQFFVTYHDNNVTYNNGTEITEPVDDDLRKSLLIQLYLNMSACYINLNNYTLATQILSDALALSDKVSQIYLRKSQLVLCNNSSTINQLKLAYQDIINAQSMQLHQKIFQTTNLNILKMCNLHDAKSVYQDVSQQIKIRIQQEQAKTNSSIKTIQSRLIQINQIQKQIIKQGKIPKQNTNSSPFTSTNDYKILIRIFWKYVRIMEFYHQAKDKSQVGLAQSQFQQILKIIHQIMFIQNISINAKNHHFGDNQSKINNRINNIKKQKCQQIYNDGKYNYQVLEWAINQIVKEERDTRQKMKKDQQQSRTKPSTEQNADEKQKPNWASKLPYIMVIIPILGLLFNYLI